MEEVKEVQKVDMSNNLISEISPLREMTRVINLNISSNRIKNVSIFTDETAFPQLKILDISNNKFTEFPAIKCPKLE